MKNVVFVRFSEQLAAAADPVALLLRLFDFYRSPAGAASSAAGDGASSRLVLPRVQQLCRLLPVQTTCHANLPALTAALERLFDRLAVLSDEQLLNPPLALPNADDKKEKEVSTAAAAQESSFRGPLTFLVLYEPRNHSAFASTQKSPPKTSASTTTSGDPASNERPSSSNEESTTPTAEAPDSHASNNPNSSEECAKTIPEGGGGGSVCSEAAPRREVTGLLRDDVLETVVRVARARRPGWRVSLERPALAIGVQVLGGSACVGLLPRYHSHAKYNVTQLQRVMLDTRSSKSS